MYTTQYFMQVLTAIAVCGGALASPTAPATGTVDPATQGTIDLTWSMCFSETTH